MARCLVCARRSFHLFRRAAHNDRGAEAGRGIKWLCLAKRAYLPTTPGHTPRERRLDAVTTMKAEEVTVMLDLSLQAVGSR